MRDLVINLITNWASEKGLTRDGCLLEALLSAWGHQPTRVQFNRPAGAGQADLNVFLETVRPNLFPLAPRQWFIPNPEWCGPEVLAVLPQFERVLCKTEEAVRVLSPLTSAAQYLGFESEDRYVPTRARSREVLHIEGNNVLRGTAAILDAWERYALPYPLLVVGTLLHRTIPQVTYLGSLVMEELRWAQNTRQIHLYPSETEGWGHALHEGLGVGALVLTTDAPPMNQMGAAHHLAAAPNGRRHLSTLSRVAPADIAAGVRWAMGLTDDEMRTLRWRTRSRWLREREAFRRRLKALLP